MWSGSYGPKHLWSLSHFFMILKSGVRPSSFVTDSSIPWIRKYASCPRRVRLGLPGKPSWPCSGILMFESLHDTLFFRALACQFLGYFPIAPSRLVTVQNTCRAVVDFAPPLVVTALIGVQLLVNTGKIEVGCHGNI
ncbi:hypothetical protein L873DRAFT_690057 [Choiromyces venosus 120613-1]|uniref:Uncharacterized protein n=1 Tax=Choiromyces venosus 120613-1 TaxID=1336337 RepID=A0A3N4JYF0_9PEZI|nr:hypothetical protein L873DRAFT_690057 [Choiromyces venosus 120613-1]